MALEVTQKNIEEVEKSGKPVVLEAYASWCGPCQQMAPIFAELAQELGDTYLFAKLNVDDARELAIKYSVTSVPTFIFMKDNQVKGKTTGYITKDDLKKKITEHLG